MERETRFPKTRTVHRTERYGRRIQRQVFALRQGLLAGDRPKHRRRGCQTSFPRTFPGCPTAAGGPSTSTYRKAAKRPPFQKAQRMLAEPYPRPGRLRLREFPQWERFPLRYYPSASTGQTLPAIHLLQRCCQTHRKGSAVYPRFFLPKAFRHSFPLFFHSPLLPFRQLRKYRKGRSKYRLRRFLLSGIHPFPYLPEKNRQSPCPGYSPTRGTRLRYRYPHPPGAASQGTRTDPRPFPLPFSFRHILPENPPGKQPAKALPQEQAPVRPDYPKAELPRQFRFSGRIPLSRRHPTDPGHVTGGNTGCAFPRYPFRHRHRRDGGERKGSRDSCSVQIYRLRLRHPNPAFPRESSTGQDFPLRSV